MSAPAIHPTVDAYFAGISAMDWDATVATFAADLHHEDPVGSPVNRSPAAAKAFFQQIGGLFRTVELRPRASFRCGDEFAVVWDGQGVGRNGAAVAFEGVDVIALDGEGRIASLRAYWDPAPVLGKLMA
ncbi:MAG: nuclear transport factor 2 family protein [Holophagaceae bacterium]